MEEFQNAFRKQNSSWIEWLESHKQNGGTPMMCYVSDRSCLLNCSKSMKYPKARMKSDGKNSDKAELK